MIHKHLFKNVGGGCGTLITGIDPKVCCDDDYECKCGEKFRVFSSMTGHRYLPESFETREMSEIKSAEQELINDTFLGSLPPSIEPPSPI